MLWEPCAVNGIKDTGINRVRPWGHADTALMSWGGRQEWREQVGETEGDGGAPAGKGEHRLPEWVAVPSTPALLGHEGLVTAGRTTGPALPCSRLRPAEGTAGRR